MRSYVWVVEDVAEEREVWCVADSPEAAWKAVKADFPVPPYIVSWHEPEQLTETEARLVGDFTAVANYSTEHRAKFAATRYELHSSIGM